MRIEIDKKSGFCFGVQHAIEKAEGLLKNNGSLTVLGEIVHNQQEINRLSKMGLLTLDSSQIDDISNSLVLLRTHGEPPSTYIRLKEANNQIVDATCPVVLKLQGRIKRSFAELEVKNGQLVILGKKGHAEVIGLAGQTNFKAIIVSNIEELDLINFSKPIELYCQTTFPIDTFREIAEIIKLKAQDSVVVHDTICRQVANRVPNLKEFSADFDVILFVSGKNSSNGKQLYEICKQTNPETYFVTMPIDICVEWFENKESVGICGATSTPIWQMEIVKEHVKAILNIR